MVKKKLALTSLFLNSSETSLCPSSSSSMSAASFSTAASWQWPPCTQARTLSFRGDSSAEIVSMRHHNQKQDEEYKTSMNPAYVPDSAEYCSCSLSDSSASLSTASEPAAVADEDEVIIRGLRSSNRLIFEPDSTSSIVNVKAATAAAFDGATALAIDSADPYGDFRRSMEEMVLSHGVNDWGWLEEMLGWYLSANGKKTHGLIVGAFVDLLVALASAPSPACSSSFIARQAVKKGKHQTEC
ncbi:transcription repressor OFP13-like [Phragmites australis]|uniref:transcription repressor OFP13-like n=1 Tax=Phragmites australis TaxID=29695 RepID=UPI002D79DB44|nr:transcription repressor OFP13-like [Phragmites australis]